MESITLHTACNHYSDIFIDTGFDNFDAIMQKYADGRRVFAMIDRNVEALYGRRFPFPKMIICADEEHKTMETAGQILQWLISENADRNSLLLGIGGGITTDLCGFAAAIYKRGISCAFIPTTLLAMIDAAIGGKNGVNMLTFKNMAGTIRQPEFVYADCNFLHSFPRRVLYKSLPEMFKVFLIDGKHFLEAVDFFAEKDAITPDFCRKMIFFITEAIRIKCKIVEADEFEEGNGTGDRRILNMGHTFAHAIEHCTSCFSHGEAVGIGLVEAAKNGGCTEVHDIENALAACGLPSQFPRDLPMTEIKKAILQDKKNADCFVNMVVLEAIGKAHVRKIALDDIIF